MVIRIAAILAILSLAITYLALRKVGQAEAARRVADQRLAKSFEFLHQVLYEVHDGVRVLPGSQSVRHLLASHTVALLDNWAIDARGDAALTLQVAKGYQRLSNILANPEVTDLNYLAASLDAFNKQHRLLESAIAIHPANEALRLQLAAVLVTLALQSRATKSLPQRLAMLDQADTHWAKIDAVPGDALFEVRKGQARTARARGYLYCTNGQQDQAPPQFEKAIAIYRDLLRTKPGDPVATASLTETAAGCPSR
jgi:tetratricopeptide (TPR) repeat protein